MQQFEELLQAARTAGPASRALPLFYALSQAGRAIVAAWGDELETYGHGLAENRDDPPTTQLLHRRIRRRPSAHGRDTFSAVARAIRAGDFDGDVELGALWVANPHSPRLPLEYWRPDWRLALSVVDEDVITSQGIQVPDQHRVIRVMPFADPLEATMAHVEDFGEKRYPTIPQGAGVATDIRDVGTAKTWHGYVVLRAAEPSLDQVAPRSHTGDSRYLVPLLPGQTKLLPPLLLWWVLLFGFSVYARYHPQLWAESINVDKSKAAAGVERLLQAAIDVLPTLVCDALLGSFYPVPPGNRLPALG